MLSSFWTLFHPARYVTPVVPLEDLRPANNFLFVFAKLTDLQLKPIHSSKMGSTDCSVWLLMSKQHRSCSRQMSLNTLGEFMHSNSHCCFIGSFSQLHFESMTTMS